MKVLLDLGLSLRAREMTLSKARVSDVRNALLTASAATWQAEQGTWRVTGGVDLDGDVLTACVEIMGDVVVVTLF